MKFIIFAIFIFSSGFLFACENAGEINVTKQCSFKYLKSSSGNLFNLVTIAITETQVKTAGGSDDGMKYLAVSAELKLLDGSTKRLSGNLMDTMISNGKLATGGTAIQDKIDEITRTSQGENPEIVNCTIYY